MHCYQEDNIAPVWNRNYATGLMRATLSAASEMRSEISIKSLVSCWLADIEGIWFVENLHYLLCLSEVIYKDEHCCVLSNLVLSDATSKRPKFVEKCGNYSRDTVKIGIRTPLKSDIYFGLSQKQYLTSQPHFTAHAKFCDIR